MFKIGDTVLIKRSKSADLFGRVIGGDRVQLLDGTITLPINNNVEYLNGPEPGLTRLTPTDEWLHNQREPRIPDPLKQDLINQAEDELSTKFKNLNEVELRKLCQLINRAI